MTDKSLEAHFVKCLKEGNTKKALYIIKLLGDKINNLYRGKSPLLWAKEFENNEVARVLEEKGAREIISDEEAKKLGIELVKKAKVGDFEAVIELVEKGANVDEKDKDGDTALMKASREGHIEVVKTLIEKGADVNQKNNYGSTPLMYASGYGTVEVVKALIENGAKVDEKNDRGCTPLMWASYNGRVEVVKMLLSMGAIKTINEKDIFRETPLMWASENGHVEVVKTLIENGAKIDEKDNNRKTAIDLTDDDEIKKMLKEALIKQKMQKFKKKISGFFGREER